MIPFTLQFAEAQLDASVPTGLDAAGAHIGGNPAGPMAFERLVNLRGVDGGPLRALTELAPAAQGCSSIARRSYKELQLKLEPNATVRYDSGRSRFPVNAAQIEVYDVEFRLSWTQTDSSLFGGNSSTGGETRIVGKIRQTFSPSPGNDVVTGLFLGVMETPMPDASPRVVISYRTTNPGAVQTAALTLTNIELHGNWDLGGAAGEVLPGITQITAVGPTFTQIIPQETMTDMSGSDRTLRGRRTGGLGFGGPGGAVAGARITSALLELLKENGDVVASTGAPGVTLTRWTGQLNPTDRKLTVTINAMGFGVGTDEEEVQVDWMIQKATGAPSCIYRVTYTLDGVGSSL